MRDVLVVGGGAVGLALAAQLLDAGLDVVVWERRPSPAGHSRAIGLHAPALEVLEATGASEQVVDEAVLVRHGIARTRARVLGTVPFDGVSARYPFVATLPQARTEEILRDRVDALDPTCVRRGTTLTGLVQRPDGVEVTGSVPLTGWALPADGRDDGRQPGDGDDAPASRQIAPAGAPFASTLALTTDVTESARCVVAADGSRSTVRDLLGVRSPLRTYPDTYVMADLADSTDAGTDAVIHLEREGVVESFPLPGGSRRWVVRTSSLVVRPTPEQLAAVVEHRTGVPVDATTCTMVSAFEVRRRLAPRTVHGRVVLLGDAAHEISPIGGQGMNLGWLDAARLAPLLLEAAHDGTLPAASLARYDTSRRRRARWAARQAELNMALGRPVDGPGATVRDTLLRAVLGSPARHALASVYAMRHLR